MHVKVQLVQNNLFQKIPSIVIFGLRRRYFFNMHHSLWRHSSYHKIKSPSNSTVFFTKLCSEGIGGIPAYLLCARRLNEHSSIEIFGNTKMFDYLQEVRFKVGYETANYSYSTWEGRTRRGIIQKAWPDLIKTTNILQNFASDNCQEYAKLEDIIDSSKNLRKSSDLEKLPISYFEDNSLVVLPFPVRVNDIEVTNYLCRTKERGYRFNILHYPSLEHLLLLKQDSLFHRLITETASCIIHIVEEGQIVRSAEFKDLVALVPKETIHLVFNREFKDQALTLKQYIHSHRHMQLTSILHQMHTDYFPDVLRQVAQSSKQSYRKAQNLEDLFPKGNVLAYKKFHELLPHNMKYAITAANYSNNEPDLKNLIQRVKQRIGEHILEARCKVKWPCDFSKFNPKIVFLGTSSTAPNRYRNVSSILLQLNDKNRIMFDCGENTLEQLYNHYPIDRTEKTLSSLRVVFLTHIHADHTLGLMDTIEKYAQAAKTSKKPLFIVMPYNLLTWFHIYCETVIDIRSHCKVVFIQSLTGEKFQKTWWQKSCKETDIRDGQKNTKLLIKLLEDYEQVEIKNLRDFKEYLIQSEITKFQPISVVHCPQSYGIVIEHSSGVKISYSGDTRPSQNFIKAAANSTLLIHEATFADQYIGKAITDKHSTLSEAITAGQNSMSWRTAITHFHHQLMPRAEVYETDHPLHKYQQENTIYCSDHLEAKLSQLADLPGISFHAKKFIDMVEKEEIREKGAVNKPQIKI